VLAPGRHEVHVRSREPFIIRTFDFTLESRPVPVELVDSALSRPTFDFAAVVENTTEREHEYVLELWINDRPSREEIPARYRSEVEYVDGWIGRLFDALVERDLYDETLIVFTSDHGEGVGQRGHIGHVHHLHDELLRVPLFIKLPRSMAGAADALRTNRERLVRHIDVVPTVLELLGLPPLRGQTGASLLTDAGARVLLAETHRPQAERDLITMRDDRRVMMYDVDADRFELYDRTDDPDELVDRFVELGGALVEWQDMLRSVAMLAREGATGTGELDPEVEKQLRALGYLGNE
jgi:arylsulfatase A-like enzyme